ncbi:ankyrin repeat domain-containing protein [Candidatus Poribacteria bacterium]|nr:ankyrin repeat domain-containing protein [Candidatus Poribacteria bacterium]
MTHDEALDIVRELDITGAAHGTVHGDFDRVKAALDGHPDAIAALNALDPAKVEETPQGSAAHRGCREILDYMLMRGVSPDVFMMCALGMTDHLRWAFRRRPHLANSRGAHGIHALNHSADRATAELLLHYDADPNCPIYEPWDWTPVHEAAANGRIDALSVMCEYGGRIDGPYYCTTPLHAAARNGQANVVRWLLGNGAGADAMGKGGPYEGRTARDIAAENGHQAIVVTLDGWRPQPASMDRSLPVIRPSARS